MNTERLGTELGDLVCETCDESIEEIGGKINTLGEMNHIFLEYIAFLLWTATKMTSTALPEKSFHHAANAACSVTFDFLNSIEDLRDHPDFNMEKFQQFIHVRFEQYYRAWEDYPVDVDEDDVYARQNFNVILCFICCCFADKTEFFNKDQSLIVDTFWFVVPHYTRFMDTVKCVLLQPSLQSPERTQRATVLARRGSGRDDGLADDDLIDFVAAEIKKDISSLMALGIKLDKGSLAAKAGGTGLAGYEAISGDWLSALVIGGISLLVGGLTNSYKRIKLMEMKKKWWDIFSGLNREELIGLEGALRQKYPMLMGQLQNLLQAPEG